MMKMESFLIKNCYINGNLWFVLYVRSLVIKRRLWWWKIENLVCKVKEKQVQEMNTSIFGKAHLVTKVAKGVCDKGVLYSILLAWPTLVDASTSRQTSDTNMSVVLGERVGASVKNKNVP